LIHTYTHQNNNEQYIHQLDKQENIILSLINDEINNFENNEGINNIEYNNSDMCTTNTTSLD
jgi:hypothetical protein